MRNPAALTPLACLCLFVAVAGCSVAMPKPVAERLQLAFDERTWVVAYREPEGQLPFTQYVPQGSDATNWTEMITERSYFGLQKSTTADGEMQRARQHAADQCATVDWSVVGQEPGSVRYVATLAGCKEARPPHEVGRFIVSPEALYVITYQSKKASMSAEEKRAWADTLARASYQDVVLEER